MESRGKKKDRDQSLGSSPCSTQPLHLAPTDEQLLIRSIRGGWDIRRRLKALGIVPGEAIRIITTSERSLDVIIAGIRRTVPLRLAHHVLVQ